MAYNDIRVPFGCGTDITLSLPSRWEIIGVCAPKPVAPSEDVDEEIRRALSDPAGSPRLGEILRSARTVAVVVDDASRPTPVHLFFHRVLEEIEAAGIPPERITILTALGVHRPMTPDEIESKIGRSAAARYRIVNHDARKGGGLIHLGRTSRGTPVWVNRVVAEADVVVCMGCVEPHVIAGFGGGLKAIVPGCAGSDTVAANHKLNTTPESFNSVGSDPEKNPMRRDLEEAGMLVPGKIFIVNAVLDGTQRVVRIVAGHPIDAHREGVRESREIFGVPVPKPCDILIASSHPLNIDLRQGFKALANTISAVRPGGMILSLVAAEQGIGDMTVPKKKLNIGKKTLRRIARLILPLVGRFRFGMKEEDAFFTYFALQAIRRNDIYFYAPNVPPVFAERLPFLDMHRDLGAVMQKCEAAFPGKATVLVFPAGGVTYPILPGA